MVQFFFGSEVRSAFSKFKLGNPAHVIFVLFHFWINFLMLSNDTGDENNKFYLKSNFKFLS